MWSSGDLKAMDLKYFHDCPTCGAPIELTEADRLIQCPYCDVKNYMVPQGPLRFVLPDKLPDQYSVDEIIYFPYLRFKGHIYSCGEKDIQHKIVDTTHLGIAAPSLPATLGLRPQAMKLSLAGADQGGRFVKVTEKMSSVFSRAASLTSLFKNKKEEVYHRSFIGETVSFIYLPTYIKDGSLFDAVLNRKIAKFTSFENSSKITRVFQSKWLPRFLSTICPHCGEVMSGARDSLVLTCLNCQSCWQEKDGKINRIDWSVVPPVKEADLFLPFWRIKIDVVGTKLKSFADFLRLSNQPVVIRPIHEQTDNCFWVPAFKIRPKYFLNFSKNLMISQLRLPPGKREMFTNLHSVTMPLVEAIQALKSVLAYSIMNKRRFFPTLPSLSFQTKKTELVYLPFSKVGRDLVQDHTSVAVASSVLSIGRTM